MTTAFASTTDVAPDGINKEVAGNPGPAVLGELVDPDEAAVWAEFLSEQIPLTKANYAAHLEGAPEGTCLAVKRALDSGIPDEVVLMRRPVNPVQARGRVNALLRWSTKQIEDPRVHVRMGTEERVLAWWNAPSLADAMRINRWTRWLSGPLAYLLVAALGIMILTGIPAMMMAPMSETESTITMYALVVASALGLSYWLIKKIPMYGIGNFLAGVLLVLTLFVGLGFLPVNFYAPVAVTCLASLASVVVILFMGNALPEMTSKAIRRGPPDWVFSSVHLVNPSVG